MRMTAFPVQVDPYGEVIASGQRYLIPTSDGFNPPEYVSTPLDSGAANQIAQGAPNSSSSGQSPAWWDFRSHPGIVVLAAIIIGLLAYRFIHFRG